MIFASLNLLLSIEVRAFPSFAYASHSRGLYNGAGIHLFRPIADSEIVYN